MRSPVQTSVFFVGVNPMPASTHTAHDVNPYTKNSGKYVMVLQQYRSTFLAHPLRRIVLEGEAGGDGEPNVAIAAPERVRCAYGGANEVVGVSTARVGRDVDPSARGCGGQGRGASKLVLQRRFQRVPAAAHEHANTG